VLADRRPAGSHQALDGLVWSVVSFGSQGFAQLALLAVLARLLTPADFGVVTATLVVINLGRICTQSVISAAVVQRPQLTDDHVRAAFWLSLGAGALAAGAMYGGAPLAASFFDMPSVEGVMRALAPVFVIQSLGVVAQGLLERELRFRAVAGADAAANLLGLATVGIVAGALGAGVWALVLGHLGHAVVQAILLVHRRRHPVALRFRQGAARELLWYGGGLLGGRLLNYLALQGDNLVVARTLSASALGAYGRAYQLVTMPAMLVGQALDRALLPLFSRRQHELPALAEQYRRAMAIVVILTLPVSVVLVVATDEIVRVMLGDGWGAVVAPLRVFGVCLVARTAYKVSDTLARATGEVYARARRQGLYAALVGIGALVGSTQGITGVAVGVTVAICVNHVSMAALCLRILPLGWSALVVAHVRPGLAALAVVPAAVGSRWALVAAGAPAAVVVVGTALAAAAGLALTMHQVPSLGGDDARWLLRQIRTWSAGR
jgi:O-antigen/teichoic acid export membrane protein